MTIVLIAAALLLIAVIVAQALIPRIGEHRLERRLTESGGEAFVAIDVFPATRLLRHDGDRIRVRGRELGIGMSKQGGGLSALDGFGEVDIVLMDFVTGPFEIEEFELTRVGSGPYVMRSVATTSGAALADYGGETLGSLGPLLGLVAQAPLGGRSFPVSVEVELESRDGLLAVASGGGTIAGYPAGPIAPLIAGAVARRLEISH
ncbi:MAG TPA: hypothetical protein VKA36_08040 [Solirubrobacterales bacterium]|nr:hypothetical protein [Solirubrobacterales bacterium]